MSLLRWTSNETFRGWFQQNGGPRINPTAQRSIHTCKLTCTFFFLSLSLSLSLSISLSISLSLSLPPSLSLYLFVSLFQAAIKIQSQIHPSLQLSIEGGGAASRLSASSPPPPPHPHTHTYTHARAHTHTHRPLTCLALSDAPSQVEALQPLHLFLSSTTSFQLTHCHRSIRATWSQCLTYSTWLRCTMEDDTEE